MQRESAHRRESTAEEEDDATAFGGHECEQVERRSNVDIPGPNAPFDGEEGMEVDDSDRDDLSIGKSGSDSEDSSSTVGTQSPIQFAREPGSTRTLVQPRLRRVRPSLETVFMPTRQCQRCSGGADEVVQFYCYVSPLYEDCLKCHNDSECCSFRTEGFTTEGYPVADAVKVAIGILDEPGERDVRCGPFGPIEGPVDRPSTPIFDKRGRASRREFRLAAPRERGRRRRSSKEGSATTGLPRLTTSTLDRTFRLGRDRTLQATLESLLASRAKSEQAIAVLTEQHDQMSASIDVLLGALSP